MLRVDSGAVSPTSAACAAVNHESTAARWVPSNAAYLVRFAADNLADLKALSMPLRSAETWPRWRR